MCSPNPVAGQSRSRVRRGRRLTIEMQNWPLWKRDVILVILCLVSVMAAALAPILAANTLTLSLIFGRNFTDIALLTGYHLCGVGVAGVLFVASARVWGRRHLYLLGTVLLIASSAWGGAADTYESILWARIIQGVAVAPFEALVNASVGDLYFVHVGPTPLIWQNPLFSTRYWSLTRYINSNVVSAWL